MIADKETAQLQQELTDIMKMIDHMQSINTDQVEPLYQPFAVNAPLRQDQITATDERVLNQQSAPNASVKPFETTSVDPNEGFYWVPPVIE